MAEPESEQSGWGENNERFYEMWPMEIPPLQTATDEDPVELPVRVPTSFLTHTQGE